MGNDSRSQHSEANPPQPLHKASTEAWLDDLHDKHLKKTTLQHQLPHPSSTIQDKLNLNNAAVAIHKLSDIWGRTINLEEQEKEEREKKLKDKGFEKLSEV